MKHWKIELDAAGIALVRFDMAGRSANMLSGEVIEELGEIVVRIETDDAIKGVVIASAKPGFFCAGGEITHIKSFAGPAPKGLEAETLAADIARMTRDTAVFRRLETSGKPVACAIEGLALGGGAELAMSSHYRVATEASKLGLPEGGLGLLAGGGGTQRLPRLVGIKAALPILLEGKPVTAAEALKLGWIQEIAPPGEAIAAAKRWIAEKGDPVQPWDKRGFQIPGGGPYAPGVSDVIAMATAMSRQKYFGNYPAQGHILTAVYEGTQVPFEAGMRIEMREFIATVRSPQALAMIRSLFLSPREIKAGANRPAGVPVKQFTKAAVIGAGLMGAGIAYAQAAVGIDTILIDVTQEAADRGKAYSAKVLEKAIKRGTMTRDNADTILARIVATADYALVAGSDIVVEAVFEDRDVKANVTRLAEAQLAPDAIVGSNTSTLPITGLATASGRPENFIGLHFFSPVERMELVEIIRGEKTSDETLAAAFDYVAAIRKLAIVVKDSRGFYTSRTITKYLDEPCQMLLDGIAPAIIENVGRMTGMPLAPLALVDAIGLELPYHVAEQTRRDLGDDYVAGPTDAVLHHMVAEQGRHGRRNGKGFYDYTPDGKGSTLWPGLADLAAPTLTDAFDECVKVDLKKRLLYSMALTAAQCIEEGVISDARETDVGAIMGFGFPSWTGGPISLIEQVGIPAFVADCDRLADLYGERFRPGPMLREMAAEGRTFY